MKKLLIIILLFPWTISAQQDVYLSLYQFNMSLINPAYAGAEGRHVISLNSRNQWSNAEDSPKTTALSYSVAGGKNVGLGISIVSDQIFIEKQTIITADFSYRLNMANDAALFLGIKAGGNSYNADPSQLRSYRPELDPVKRPLVDNFLVLGHLLQPNGSIRSCWTSARKAMWKAFWTNPGAKAAQKLS